MVMNTNPKQKPNTSLDSLKIHHLITVGEFLKRIGEDADSSFTDFDVKYAIEKLQNWCFSDNSEQKRNGRHILKKAGLAAYIPKRARRKLGKYENNPYRFFGELDTLTEIFKKALPKRAKSDKQKKEVIRKLLESDKLERINEHAFKKAFPNLSFRYCRNIALGWIGYENRTSFKTAQRLYDDLKKRETQHKKVLHPYLKSYNHAYVDYVLTEHKSAEWNEISERIRDVLSPSQDVMTALGKKLEEDLKPLKQALSKIPPLKVSNLSKI